jgi:putative spermidine/putrescine transport system ATP-binding protein
VRRDRIHLAKQKPVDSPNAVSGKVRAIEYQGTWVKITLEGASDEEFVVNMPDTEFFVDPINTGDMVRAHWKTADVHPLVGSSRSDRPHASGQN